jgi:hypothetical protein
MRRTGRRANRRIVAAAACCFLSASLPIRLAAQSAPDSARLVGPVGALWRSLVLPGWGQAATGRNVTGALFVAWEGTTMYMTIKAHQEVNYFKASDSTNLHSKRQEVQDWLVLWGFNHLFAGAEAFVAAHLRDFPRDLRVRAVPGGIGVSLPLPSR